MLVAANEIKSKIPFASITLIVLEVLEINLSYLQYIF